MQGEVSKAAGDTVHRLLWGPQRHQLEFRPQLTFASSGLITERLAPLCTGV